MTNPELTIYPCGLVAQWIEIAFSRGSRGGLMVSALGSGSGGAGSSLGQGAALCS